MIVAAAVAWGRRAVLALLAWPFSRPPSRWPCRRCGTTWWEVPARVDKVTSGRANLVSQGIRIAADHPVLGVGVGGFRRAYAERTGVSGTDPKRVASHTTPITVAAEGGIVGLAVLAGSSSRR